MTKVLFTHSYFYKLDSKQWETRQPYPPLGTIQAAAVVRDAGFEVSLFDSNLRDSPEEIEATLDEFGPDCLVIYDDGFNYLTKMCLTIMRDAALKMTEAAKDRDVVVIICSSDSTDQYRLYLDSGVDYVIRGEGEEALVELLCQLDSGSMPDSIQNLAHKQDQEFIVSSNRAVLRVLDDLPMPAWDLVDIDSYKQVWSRAHGYFSLNIATTRGCPYKCNWCAKPIYGNRYNARSPEHVVNEIEYLIANYQPDHFWICDDIFGLRPGWADKFAALVEAKGLNFDYKIQSRVDLLQDEQTVRTLKKSGLRTAWLGAESGSQQILDAMDKGTTVEQIRIATQLLKKHNVNVGFFLQFGYPGENMDDIRQTLNMVLDLMPDEIGISVSYPLPGTKFYDRVRDELKTKANWSDSDDLSMMFRNTYPPAFYKALHRYVHNRYRVKRGVNQLRAPVRFGLKESRKVLSMIYNLPQMWFREYQIRKLSET